MSVFTGEAPALRARRCDKYADPPSSAACQMKNGRYYEMRAGDLFYIGPGHDSWVVGDEPYVSLHFLGADHYARR